MWPFDKAKHNGRELVAAGATLLDVRSPGEFAGQHVEGALNIPVQQLATRVHELKGRSRSVVVYCRSGMRSRTAAELLKAQGFDVVDIGGMGNW